MKKRVSGIGKVRVSGGKWRGRNLYFCPNNELRPTKSVVRETLFNWLRPFISGKVCLDCFSGSSSLAFESISQGASKAVCLEENKECLTKIKKNIDVFKTDDISVYYWSFPSSLPLKASQTYDLVFLDPPFAKIGINQTIQWCLENISFSKGALIYVELSKKEEWPKFSWLETIKRSTSGGVDFGLLKVINGGVK